MYILKQINKFLKISLNYIKKYNDRKIRLMNKKRLSFLILTSFLIYNIASYNKVVLAKESNFENSTNSPIINGIKI